MISVKFHETVVSLCDEELIGKSFEDVKHSLVVSERFFRGEEMRKKQVLEVLKHATSMNLVGKKIIAIALEAGYIKKEDILTIQGVPHVQIYSC